MQCMGENPYQAPAAANDRQPMRWFFLSFYALAIVWGLRNVEYGRPSALDVLTPVAEATCLAWWALSDARQRGRPIPFNVRAWFFLLAFIVVPGYVISSRGWRGIVWVALNAFTWYALCLFTMLLGRYVAFGSA